MSARSASGLRVALALGLAACGSDVPPWQPPDACSLPVAPGHVCDVTEACCRQRLTTAVADHLGVPALVGLTVELTPSSEYCAEVSSLGWAGDQLQDALQTEALLRFGLHRRAHRSQAAVAAAVTCSFFAGWYDSWTGMLRLVVPDDPAERELDKEMIVFAHEVVHAHQDLRYGLADWRKAHRLAGGESEAASAVIEGQAELVEHFVRLGLEDTGPADVDWQAWADGRWQALVAEVDAAAEPWLTERYDFRYRFGTGLAVGRYLAAGGRAEATWALFDAPPQTTRQVMDIVWTGSDQGTPEVTHAPPDLSDSAAELGLWWFDTWRLDAWQAALWLAPDLGAAEALDATAGWSGGEVQVFVVDQGGDLDPVFVLATTWATPADADAFADAIELAYEQRAGFSDSALVQVAGGTVRFVQAGAPSLVAALGATLSAP